MDRQSIPGYCPLCISRCGCVSVVENGVLVKVEPDPNHPTGKSLCIKGKSAPELVNSAERVLYPLKRTRPKGAPDPGWERISWEEALDFTAAGMSRIAQESGPEAVAFTVTTPSGTAVADGVGWIFRLINAFGSPNAVWTSHICNWHKDFTPLLTFGADIGMPDYRNTGCILYWGFNPTACWPAQAQEAAQAVKRGAKLIVVDPRRAGLANKADQWLRVRPGTDGALALGLAGEMIAKGWYDREFIASWSTAPFLVRNDNGRFLKEADLGADGGDGFVAWDEAVGRPMVCAAGAYDSPRASARSGSESPGGAAPMQPALFGEFEVETIHGSLRCRPAFDLYAALCRDTPPERVEQITGVPAQQVRDTARLLHESGPLSHYAWSGVGQGTNATQTGRAISLLCALTGSFDAPGGNAHFAKPTVNSVFGFDLLPPGQRTKALGADERPLGPAAKGWINDRDLYRAILDGRPYPVKGLVGFGSNLLLSRPSPEMGRQALEKLDFYVHADLFLTPMAQYADVVLPVASPWEREGLAAGFLASQEADALLQLRARVVAPRGEARSDTWIVFELAKRLGLDRDFFGGDIEAALRHVLAPSGVSLEILRARPEGVSLPLATRYRKYRHSGFATPSGRVEIYSQQLLEAGQPPLPVFVEPQPQASKNEFPLVLTTAKTVQFCHSQHRSLPALRRRMPDPLVALHPAAAAARGIAGGDWVTVRSPAGKMKAKAELDPSLAPDTVCAQFGWWQPCPELGRDGYPAVGEGSANYGGLIDNRYCDPVSGSLPLRGYPCEVEKGT